MSKCLKVSGTGQEKHVLNGTYRNSGNTWQLNAPTQSPSERLQHNSRLFHSLPVGYTVLPFYSHTNRELQQFNWAFATFFISTVTSCMACAAMFSLQLSATNAARVLVSSMNRFKWSPSNDFRVALADFGGKAGRTSGALGTSAWKQNNLNQLQPVQNVHCAQMAKRLHHTYLFSHYFSITAIAQIILDRSVSVKFSTVECNGQ